MKDTSPEMEARYRRMLMALSPEARLQKACAMFDTAKQLVLASLRAELGPASDPTELRRRLLLRFYGDELPVETIRQLTDRYRRSRDPVPRP